MCMRHPRIHISMYTKQSNIARTTRIYIQIDIIHNLRYMYQSKMYTPTQGLTHDIFHLDDVHIISLNIRNIIK